MYYRIAIEAESFKDLIWALAAAPENLQERIYNIGTRPSRVASHPASKNNGPVAIVSFKAPEDFDLEAPLRQYVETLVEQGSLCVSLYVSDETDPAFAIAGWTELRMM